MLQQKEPDDYVIATGKSHSIRELLEVAFERVNLKWEDYVIIDKKLYRASDKHELRGDYSKAKKKLDWEPKVSFEELICMMVDADIKELQRQQLNKV